MCVVFSPFLLLSLHFSSSYHPSLLSFLPSFLLSSSYGNSFSPFLLPLSSFLLSPFLLWYLRWRVMTLMQTLSLSMNRMSGTLLKVWSNMTRMTQLDLSSNSFVSHLSTPQHPRTVPQLITLHPHIPPPHPLLHIHGNTQHDAHCPEATYTLCSNSSGHMPCIVSLALSVAL